MIQLEFLQTVFKESTRAFSFLTVQGEIILVDSQSGADFLSTVQSARFVLKYFPLENGDWMALNDPQIGGYSPFGINFVGRIENLIWSVRVEGPGRWSPTDKWDSAGLRLPPLPYKTKGLINQQIPSSFLEKVFPFEKKIKKDLSHLEKFVAWNSRKLTRQLFQNHFDMSAAALSQKLDETPWSEHHHRSRTRFGEVLCTQASVSKKLFTLDLAGTQPSQQLGLSEAMSDSVLTFACVQALGCQRIYNSGTEKFIQITRPRLSWLSVQEPPHPAFVRFVSFPFVESHLKQLFLKMKFPVEAWKCSMDGWMQFQFPSGHLVTTDDLQSSWGTEKNEISLIRTEENALILETTEPCELFRVDSGNLETYRLEKGSQFHLQLS
jgi:hypothetical protein